MDSAMQRCSQPQNIDLKNIHLNIKLLHSQHSHCTILLQKRKTPTLPFSRFSLLGEGGEKMKPFPLVHKKEKAHRDWLWSPEISSFTSIYTAPVLCSDWLLFESIHVKITWLSPRPPCSKSRPGDDWQADRRDLVEWDTASRQQQWAVPSAVETWVTLVEGVTRSLFVYLIHMFS